MTIRSALIGMTMLLAGTTNAMAFCMPPDAPSCVRGYGAFSDEWEFDSCKTDMERYQSEIDDFTQCKQRQVDEANDAARTAVSEAESTASKARNEVEQVSADYNDAVRDFNQRAGGN